MGPGAFDARDNPARDKHPIQCGRGAELPPDTSSYGSQR